MIETSYEPLLNEEICESMYNALNNTNVFSYDEGLRARHTQVCTVMDRLRHAVLWVNAHPCLPRGINAQTDLMTFMMFASVVKDSIQELRKAFGVQSAIFDKMHRDSRQYFVDACKSRPLLIKEDELPTDDEFFQYFRSLVFAHSSGVTNHPKILKSGEIQYCPFVVERSLKNYANEPDDYVGVMIYSSVEERDWKILRVRFSALRAYLRSRYESLGLVLNEVVGKIKANDKAWRKVIVDPSLSPRDQLQFMKDEFDKRCEGLMSYETQKMIDLIDASCTAEVNAENVSLYRKVLIEQVPKLCERFSKLDYDGFVTIVDHFTEHEIDENEKLNYTLGKIFEYLDTSDKHCWADADIETVAGGFAKKWVVINRETMSDAEIKMLITVACYFEYGQYQDGFADGRNPVAAENRGFNA